MSLRPPAPCPRALQPMAGLALAALLLAGCQAPLPVAERPAPTTAPVAAPAMPAASAPGVLAAPPALLLQGLPPVSAGLPLALARYTDSAGHGLADWHAVAREMFVRHRPAGGNTLQLWRVSGPGAAPLQLTDGEDPVGAALCEPQACRYLVFERSSGGNEAFQLYRQDPVGGAAQRVTPPDARHRINLWLRRTPELVYSSVPLDRTATGGRRSEVSTTLWRMDPLAPEQRRLITELPGGGWQAAAVQRDDSQFALLRHVSAASSEVWLLDLASGQRRRVLPADGAPAAAYEPVDFSPDGRLLYLSSDRGGEFSALWRLSLADGQLTRLGDDLPWDVDGVELSGDGERLALRVNVDGRHQLRVLDARSGAALALPALPPGNVTMLRFHPQRQDLAFAVNNAQGPSQLYSLDLARSVVERWTVPRLHPALDVAGLTEQQIVRWTSFDGRTISGLLNRPPARFAGRRPVLIDIHGGPEGQAQVGFAGRNNHLLQDLGIAIIAPNVRGSSGFGKTFLALDNGRLREDSVKDIGALLDWIATQPDLDARRVVVTGGSYGGYMSLAVAATYADRIAGAIDEVGISHFVTFLQNTESYRRDLRRVEYGDERDPAMREFLDRISPLSNAQRIRKPLFVVQGKNDPRVPYTEAEQIVAKVRAGGGTVWYLRADNEGHGFARKENADYLFYATVLFLQQVLGLPTSD